MTNRQALQRRPVWRQQNLLSRNVRAMTASLVVVISSAYAGDSATSALTTPEIANVVAAGTKIELIKEGFTGTEGPITLPDGSLIFTETQANRVTKIATDNSISTYLENSNGANGLAFNDKGDLFAVQVLDPKVGIIAPQGHVKALAQNYEGTAFVRPNDIVLAKNNGIYFTDSGAAPRPEGVPATTPLPAPRPAVYYISPAGKLQRIANDIERPNGIQLSRDEKTLYVANTLGEYVLAYDIEKDGVIKNRKNFAKLAGFAQQGEGGPNSGADGLAIDNDGRLYVASNAGIEVFNSEGNALGIIPLPKKPQNLAFAGSDKKTLYVVGRGSAYKIATQTAGFKGRAK